MNLQEGLGMAAFISRPNPVKVSAISNTSGATTTMEASLRTPRVIDLADFNELVLAHQDNLYNQAYRMLGDHSAVEDATQEAFIIAYKKFHTYRGGLLVGWLLRIVTNLCIDEIRRRKRSRILPLEPLDGYGESIESPEWLADPVESPEEAAERGDVRAALQACINRLPIEYRGALLMVDMQGRSYAEAAEVIGCSVGAVKSRLARARLFLRADLNVIFQIASY
jgi:RNA polymerase sigma-70 factor (ECF subfamily)